MTFWRNGTWITIVNYKRKFMAFNLFNLTAYICFIGQFNTTRLFNQIIFGDLRQSKYDTFSLDSRFFVFEWGFFVFFNFFFALRILPQTRKRCCSLSSISFSLRAF